MNWWFRKAAANHLAAHRSHQFFNNKYSIMIALLEQIVGAAGERPMNEVIKEAVLLVDVRSPEEFASGSVDGAINIPLGVLSQNFAVFQNRQNIVVFCRSGARSGQAKMLLEQNGFTGVINGGPWQRVQEALERVLQRN